MEEKTLELINNFGKERFQETLGLKFTEFNRENKSCVAAFTVTQGLTQPMGLLNGGASAGVMETVGSALTSVYMDYMKEYNLGLSLSVNHIGGAKLGTELLAYAEIVHKGRKTHIVKIDIKTTDGKMISSGTLTNIILSTEKL